MSNAGGNAKQMKSKSTRFYVICIQLTQRWMPNTYFQIIEQSLALFIQDDQKSSEG